MCHWNWTDVFFNACTQNKYRGMVPQIIVYREEWLWSLTKNLVFVQHNNCLLLRKPSKNFWLDTKQNVVHGSGPSNITIIVSFVSSLQGMTVTFPCINYTQMSQMAHTKAEWLQTEGIYSLCCCELQTYTSELL